MGFFAPAKSSLDDSKEVQIKGFSPWQRTKD